MDHEADDHRVVDRQQQRSRVARDERLDGLGTIGRTVGVLGSQTPEPQDLIDIIQDGGVEGDARNRGLRRSQRRRQLREKATRARPGPA